MKQLILFTSPLAALGMATILSDMASVRAEEAKTEVPHYRPFTLSAEAGSTGLGGSARWRFLDHLGIGGGFNTFSFSFDVEGEGVEFDSTIRLQAAPLTLDLYPFKKRFFRVSAGLAFNGNEISNTATFTEDQQVGDNVYTPAELGALSLDVDLGNRVVPYVGVGGVAFHFDKARRWSLGWEAGVMITGSPDVSLRSSNSTSALDADIELERQSIKNDLDGFKFWPVLKIVLSFSF